MYPVQVGKGPCGVSIPKGWTIVEVHGNLFYKKEPPMHVIATSVAAVEYALEFLRNR